MKLDGRGSQVSLNVFNAGRQIREELVPALFNALQRGDNIRPDENETSLGMGLFIVQQIAHAHGGKVRCTSTPTGTSFEILLPR